MTDSRKTGSPESAPEDADGTEPPPLGGSWQALYAAVLLNLLILVASFALLTRLF